MPAPRCDTIKRGSGGRLPPKRSHPEAIAELAGSASENPTWRRGVTLQRDPSRPRGRGSNVSRCGSHWTASAGVTRIASVRASRRDTTGRGPVALDPVPGAHLGGFARRSMLWEHCSDAQRPKQGSREGGYSSAPASGFARTVETAPGLGLGSRHIKQPLDAEADALARPHRLTVALHGPTIALESCHAATGPPLATPSGGPRPQLDRFAQVPMAGQEGPNNPQDTVHVMLRSASPKAEQPPPRGGPHKRRGAGPCSSRGQPSAFLGILAAGPISPRPPRPSPGYRPGSLPGAVTKRRSAASGRGRRWSFRRPACRPACRRACRNGVRSVAQRRYRLSLHRTAKPANPCRHHQSASHWKTGT